MELDELIAKANMYASACTGQEEKFASFQDKGCTWRWVDCVAAFQLIRELPNWWELVQTWKHEHQCKECGFPNDYHAYICRLGGNY